MTFADLPDPRWRGRSRLQVEHDVLAAMLTIDPFRRRARALLRPQHFTSSTHAALWRATDTIIPPAEVEQHVAAAIGCNIEQAERWLLSASTFDYDSDLGLLVSL